MGWHLKRKLCSSSQKKKPQQHRRSVCPTFIFYKNQVSMIISTLRQKVKKERKECNAKILFSNFSKQARETSQLSPWMLDKWLLRVASCVQVTRVARGPQVILGTYTHAAIRNNDMSRTLGRVKKLVVYHPRFSTKFGRADGFFLNFLYTAYVGCVSNPAARCVTVGVAVYCTWRRR